MNLSKLDKWLEDNFSNIIKIRRWLHKHPEVGFNEYKTSRLFPESTIVAIDSAWIKSILPCIKALYEYSPGMAWRKPKFSIREIIFFSTTIPP